MNPMSATPYKTKLAQQIFVFIGLSENRWYRLPAGQALTA